MVNSYEETTIIFCVVVIYTGTSCSALYPVFWCLWYLYAYSNTYLNINFTTEPSDYTKAYIKWMLWFLHIYTFDQNSDIILFYYYIQFSFNVQAKRAPDQSNIEPCSYVRTILFQQISLDNKWCYNN